MCSRALHVIYVRMCLRPLHVIYVYLSYLCMSCNSIYISFMLECMFCDFHSSIRRSDCESFFLIKSLLLLACRNYNFSIVLCMYVLFRRRCFRLTDGLPFSRVWIACTWNARVHARGMYVCMHVECTYACMWNACALFNIRNFFLIHVYVMLVSCFNHARRDVKKDAAHVMWMSCIFLVNTMPMLSVTWN